MHRGAAGSRALSRYLGQASRIAADVVDNDPVALAIRDLGNWRGTAGELFGIITPERPPRGWPSLARSLVARLRRLAPALRAMGVEVTLGEHTMRGRKVSIAVVETPAPPSPSTAAVHRHPELVALRERSERGDASAERKLIQRIRAILHQQRQQRGAQRQRRTR